MPHPAALLGAWEAGYAVPTAGGRTQLLHALARPDRSTEELLSLPLGTRDADLFALRRSLFGDRMDVSMTCPACTTELEFAVSAIDLLQDQGEPSWGEQSDAATFSSGDWAVRFRLPTVGDLTAAVAAANGTTGATRGGPTPSRRAARDALIGRIVLDAARSGKPVDTSELPGSLVSELAARVATADPTADICLTGDCPDCGVPFRAQLDIADYLWSELDVWARSLLTEVHLLALAYGWTEPDVLALSPLRRHYYLGLAGHG